MKQPYYIDNKFIYRRPLLERRRYLEIQNGETLNIVKNAIFFSSKEFFSRIDNKPLNSKWKKKELLTYYKYLLRITNKPTPFGVFSGTGVGYFNNFSKEKINKDKYSLHFDLNFDVYKPYLEKLYHNTDYLNNEVFSLNTTIYEFNNQFRYIERVDVNNNSEYTLSEISINQGTQIIFKFCSTPKKGSEIIEKLNHLIPNIEKEDCVEFLKELVLSQILVGSLYFKINNADYLEYFISNSRALLFNNSNVLEQLYTSFKKLNRKKMSLLEMEKTISDNIIYKFSDDIVAKNINVNMYFNEEIKLPKNLLKNINNATSIFMQFSRYDNKRLLETFVNKYIERYDKEEIPLLEALDPDVGIGFAHFNSFHSSVSEIPNVDNFNNPKTEVNEILTNYYKVSEKMIINNPAIHLDEKVTKKSIDLPNSLSVGIELLYNEGCDKPLIYVKFISGSSAINLLARFTKGNTEIESYVQSILSKEKLQRDPEYLYAEIGYLPNVLSASSVLNKKNFEEWELPILSNSSLSEEKTISMNDLFIKVNENNEVGIFSRKHGKEVIPRNSTAIEFSYKTNPLYYFLSAIQEKKEKVVTIIYDWQKNLHQKYYPRVVINNNIVVFLAKWVLRFNKMSKTNERRCLIEKEVLKLGIPSKVWLYKGIENKILIDFDIDLSYDLLLNETLGFDEIIFEEYLPHFNPNNPDVENDYMLEYLFTLHKKHLKKS